MATKRLALELGLVQKRKVKEGSSRACKVAQEFDFLVVLDFESTCWDNGARMGRQEIIEFPAVLLRTATGEIMSEFHQYVMPVEQPILSEFCKNLTGITQEQVEAGVPLGTCLGLFSSWIRKLCDEHQMSFNTSVASKHVTFATWSDWDLGVCLHYECNRKQLRKPEFFNQWIDVKLTYKNFYQRRPQGLAGALKDLGISFEGREHSGICDTRNTAVLISRMAKDGCILKITKCLTAKAKGITVREAAQKLFNQVKKVILGKRPSEGAEDRRKHSKVPRPALSGGAAASREDLEEDGNDKDNSDCISFSLGLSGLMGNNLGPADASSKDLGGGSRAVVKAGGVSEKAAFSNVCNGGRKSTKPLIPLKCITNTVKNENEHANTLPTPKLHSVTSDSFKTPALPIVRSGSRVSTGLSKSLVNTPMHLNKSSASSVESDKNCFKYKRTPPFCGCGRRAKLLLTSKPGPNEGRYFFSCPNGGTGSRKSCKFFKWEDEPFVKAPTIDSFCVPYVNSKSSVRSLPVQRVVRVSDIRVRVPRQSLLAVRKSDVLGCPDVCLSLTCRRRNSGKPCQIRAVWRQSLNKQTEDRH
ncbi:ERI1 exoribonuclease 2-like isoform X1 [Macrobrachium rosenbergii]|uniref:ERI1 exoribonuclease 2-like isoform X1 n=1 Tax=Macrobrachium rosenbergii TaxID=79674 RepID=UPI0034D76658